LSIQWFSRETLIQTVENHIQKADVVLDIGCGIRPQQFITPLLYICCEPHDEYLQVLKGNFAGTNTVLIQGSAQKVLRWMPDDSIDSIFMIDFIEHIEKGEGLRLIAECERIARQQIIIFTPLGFMSQDYKPGEVDAWSLHGTKWQVHKSGWTPEDFDDSWNILAAKDYHIYNEKGEKFDTPRGAFWAIKNLKISPIAETIVLSNTKQIANDSETRTSQVLLRLLSNIDRHIRGLIDPKKTEMAQHLCQRESELRAQTSLLDWREASLNQREARYNSLLPVRIVRQLRRMFRRSG
jgi:hypothetical protein